MASKESGIGQPVGFAIKQARQDEEMPGHCDRSEGIMRKFEEITLRLASRRALCPGRGAYAR
ncbi:hypothetical protein NA8A_11230 [Nitratireductor indicus C115]|uniref:Uncharacterized protein n=1 Tax=Nitratireductor indicus C115 TaxID=1231190 RepID=K2PM40_9HYPH|nr:hypothetical protein NA8A_11230 [Nitratireductor indicus C115]